MSTPECLEALQTGNPAQVRRLYAEYAPAVIRLIQESGGDKEDARDVFQSALVVFFERCHAGSFTMFSDFGAELLATCQTIWRKRQKIYPSPAPTAMGDTSLNELITEEEKNRLFRECFRRLGAKCQILLAFFFDGHPLEVICEQMGYPSTEHAVQKKDNCKQQLTHQIKQDPRYTELSA